MKNPKSMLLGAIALAALALPAAAQVNVKIGVLSDMSSLYADLGGAGSVAAARLAVEDFNAAAKGLKVEIVSADHQNKADVGSNIARQWFDRDGVDVIVDVPNSGVALAVNGVTKEKNKVFLVSGAATSALTGEQCSPNTVHWTYDTWALANGTGKAIVQQGGDTWFFVTADYAFGHQLEADTAAVVNKLGGKVLGSVRHPLNGSDFSSFLLQAQASKAKIIGIANAGGDTINTIKQAGEFGIVKRGQNLAGLLIFISDVHGLGLEAAQGLVFTNSFYWDANDGTRAFAKRIAAANRGVHPTMVHAGVYASVLHYLKAVEANKSAADGKATVDRMKAIATDDPLFGKGTVRADGRKIHDMYLYEVKKPSESKGPWDYYKLRATIPAAEAFRPLAEGKCPIAGS
jgi:branched-chain amino acid transport system substrate-binding protein